MSNLPNIDFSSNPNQDLDIFRENIYKHVTETFTNLDKSIQNLKFQYENKFQTFNSDFDKVNLKLDSIKYANESELEKLNKVENLEKFKEIAEADLFSLDSKLYNVKTELQRVCRKYDTIFLENLEIPGVVGSGKKCIYRDLREYILVSVL